MSLFDLPDSGVTLPDFELSDEQLRASGTMKWTLPPTDVLAAWVAEMDVRPCDPVAAVLHAAIDAGMLGYPPPDAASGIAAATADFHFAQYGWAFDPSRVVVCGDVMAGIGLALDHLCQPGPVVVPVPVYPPFLDVVGLHGRDLITVDCVRPASATDEPGWTLDVTAIGDALAAGARTVLISHPHNPLGRSYSEAELTALRDVVEQHGATVISDEIHAPLALGTTHHVPYASVPGANEHTITVTSASKAFNMPALKCAQVIASSTEQADLLRALPITANHGSSGLGIVASVAAYTQGGPWLQGLRDHLTDRRDQLTKLIATHLPNVTCYPAQAGYLAWLEVAPDSAPSAPGQSVLGSSGLNTATAPGLNTPIASSTVAATSPAVLALAKGRVMVNPGATFGPGYDHFVRLNFATSAERLERLVTGLATAWK